jgi:hypothetical protein
MRVMMVVMVASQHESFNLRDLARLVNSKESIGLIGFGNSSSVPILDFVRARTYASHMQSRHAC